MNLTDFHFLRPLWFLALIPLALLINYLCKRGMTSRQWETVCDPELLPHILVGRSGKRHYLSEILIALAGVVMIVALAGPTWERLPQPVYKKESALVIGLDLSLSMFADDVKPSRLERARFEIADLLEKRKEGQTALLVYAGDAFTVTPLTDDVKTINSQLSALSPAIMPSPGSQTGLALSLARDLLTQAGIPEGDILLVTDEIADRYETDIEASKNQGYRVSILGIGTREGAPIKLDNGRFLEAPDGSIVIPKLAASRLQAMAETGGGKYQTSRIDDDDINDLHQLFMNDLDRNNESATDLQSDQWYEFGPWLLIPLLPLVALGFRRGLLSITVAVLVFHQEPLMAFDWDRLWLNDDQRAKQALENEQPEVAAELFDDPQWKAAAQYRAGDFAGAEALLQDRAEAEAKYNRANALARQGRYQEAIDVYNEVLEQQPEHEDARYNRELLQQELEKQQQSQSTSQAGEQQQQEQSDNNEDQQGQQQQDNDEQGQQQQQDSKQEQQTGSDSQKQQQSQQQTQPSEQQDQSETEETKDKEAEQQTTAQLRDELDEEQQASEQWLRRIPDDPAGLLRRKFKYQYQQRERQNNNEQYW